ncbi:MAG: hypothetical protein IJF78_11960 [Clostridia bacterium]|nr:hypothetical protein [Clostridia bacterium]
MKYLSSLFTVSSMILLLVMGDTVNTAVLSSLELCVTRVIPPLFPSMVLSSVIISMNLAEPLYRYLPTEKWFGLPRCAAPVLITGLLCGFPVGASGCAQLVRENRISRKDAAVLCAVSSAAGPAFVIGSVGQWWTKEYGLVLWLTQVVFCLFSAAFVLRGSGEYGSAESDFPPSVPCLPVCFCRSVASAASSCLTVTAYITFFGTAAEVLSQLIPPLTPLFSVIPEFSRGAAFGARTGGMSGIIMTGAAVGFSGISVLMQTASFLVPENISLRPVLGIKIAGMAVSSAVSAVYYTFRKPAPSGLPVSGSVFSLPAAFAVIFLLGLLADTAKSLSKRLKRTETRGKP